MCFKSFSEEVVSAWVFHRGRVRFIATSGATMEKDAFVYNGRNLFRGIIVVFLSVSPVKVKRTTKCQSRSTYMPVLLLTIIPLVQRTINNVVIVSIQIELEVMEYYI